VRFARIYINYGCVFAFFAWPSSVALRTNIVAIWPPFSRYVFTSTEFTDHHSFLSVSERERSGSSLGYLTALTYSACGCVSVLKVQRFSSDTDISPGVSSLYSTRGFVLFCYIYSAATSLPVKN
jgi:hypothetical protein